MSCFFRLTFDVQNLIYAMTQVARNGASTSDREFASRMVSASYDPAWRPDRTAVQRMRMLSCEARQEVSA